MTWGGTRKLACRSGHGGSPGATWCRVCRCDRVPHVGSVRARWTGLLVAGLLWLGAGTAVAQLPPFVPPPPSVPQPSGLVSGPVTHPLADHAGWSLPLPGPLQPPAATRGKPLGLDVSGWQGAVDWPAVRVAGASFAYVKATEGTGYLNPFFAQQYDGAASVGLLRGAYHFALPDRGGGAAQAAYLLDHGGGWTPDGITLPPVLDIEFNPYGPTCYGLTSAQLVAWIADFSAAVQRRIGRPPVIYTNTNWWVTCTGNSRAFGDHPLWIARFADTMGPLPASWGGQTIWQYSNRGRFPGDQDVFNGSLQQLRSFAGGEWSLPGILSWLGSWLP